MKKLAVLFLFAFGAILWSLNHQSNQIQEFAKNTTQVKIDIEQTEIDEDGASFDLSKIDFPSIFSALINSL